MSQERIYAFCVRAELKPTVVTKFSSNKSATATTTTTKMLRNVSIPLSSSIFYSDSRSVHDAENPNDVHRREIVFGSMTENLYSFQCELSNENAFFQLLLSRFFLVVLFAFTSEKQFIEWFA